MRSDDVCSSLTNKVLDGYRTSVSKLYPAVTYEASICIQEGETKGDLRASCESLFQHVGQQFLVTIATEDRRNLHRLFDSVSAEDLGLLIRRRDIEAPEERIQ